VTLEAPVSHAVIGLLDGGHRIQTLDIQAAAPDGNSMGRNKRISKLAIGLHRTMGGFAQVLERTLIGGQRTAGQRKALLEAPVLDDNPVERTGIARLSLPSGHSEQLSLRILPDGGAPLTITALVPQVDEVGG
jgi:hypothetical protein